MFGFRGEGPPDKNRAAWCWRLPPGSRRTARLQVVTWPPPEPRITVEESTAILRRGTRPDSRSSSLFREGQCTGAAGRTDLDRSFESSRGFLGSTSAPRRCERDRPSRANGRSRNAKAGQGRTIGLQQLMGSASRILRRGVACVGGCSLSPVKGFPGTGRDRSRWVCLAARPGRLCNEPDGGCWQEKSRSGWPSAGESEQPPRSSLSCPR